MLQDITDDESTFRQVGSWLNKQQAITLTQIYVPR